MWRNIFLVAVRQYNVFPCCFKRRNHTSTSLALVSLKSEWTTMTTFTHMFYRLIVGITNCTPLVGTETSGLLRGITICTSHTLRRTTSASRAYEIGLPVSNHIFFNGMVWQYHNVWPFSQHFPTPYCVENQQQTFVETDFRGRGDSRFMREAFRLTFGLGSRRLWRGCLRGSRKCENRVSSKQKRSNFSLAPSALA